MGILKIIKTFPTGEKEEKQIDLDKEAKLNDNSKNNKKRKSVGETATTDSDAE